MYIFILSLTSVLENCGWAEPGPTCFTTRKSRGTHCMDGIQGRAGRIWSNSPPSDVDPWTVQTIQNRYTDW